MARIKIDRNNFSLGIINKAVQGNTDLDKYDNALDDCVNFQINHTGGVSKRGGTKFADIIRETSTNMFFKPFMYDIDNVYMFLFKDNLVNIYDTDGNYYTHLNIDNLQASEIKQYDFFQEGNYLYFLTGTHGLCRIKRNDTFTTPLNAFTFEFNLPYNNEGLTFCNTYPIAVKPDRDHDDANNQITFTVVNAEHPDDPTHFPPDLQYRDYYANANDLHKHLILTYIFEDSSISVYYVEITAITNPANAYPVITGRLDRKKCQNPEPLHPDDPNDKSIKLPSLDANYRWQLCGFSDSVRGLPQLCAMYEGRLFICKTNQYPTGIWGSSLLYDDVLDFYAGSRSVDGLQYKIKLNNSHSIKWLTTIGKIFIGSSDGVYLAGAATANEEAITPGNFRSRLLSNIGVNDLKPVQGMDTVFFVDNSNKNVHEIVYSGDVGMYQVNDISLLSNDLTQSGITCHAWQQQPVKTYWCAVKNGFLCSLTYLKNNGIFAWARHELGGDNVSVEDICVMKYGKNDYLWILTRRELRGHIVRAVEMLSPPFNAVLQDEFKQSYLDFSVTHEIKYTISNITKSVTSVIDFNHLPIAELNNLKDLARYNENKLYLLKRYRGIPPIGLPEVSLHVADKFDYINNRALFLQKYVFAGGETDVEYLPFDNEHIPATFDVIFTRMGIIKKVVHIAGATRLYLDTILHIIQFRNYRIFLYKSGLLYAPFGGEIDINTHYEGVAFNIINIDINEHYIDIRGDTMPKPDPADPGRNIGLAEDSAVYIDIQRYEVIASRPTEITISSVFNTLEPDIRNQFLNKEIYINKVFGMTDINNTRALIHHVRADTDAQGNPTAVLDIYINYKDQNIMYDTSSYHLYNTLIDRNGNIYIYFNEFTSSKLRELIGERLSVCCDGNYIGEQVVGERTVIPPPTDGLITLENSCMHCVVGYKYVSELVTLNPSKGSVINSVVGSKKYNKSIYLQLNNSLGGDYRIGRKGEFFAIPYEGLYGNLNKPSMLKSGTVKCVTLGPSEPYDSTITIRHDEPVSFNLLSITQDVYVSDN